jgi:hypothetical protein
MLCLFFRGTDPDLFMQLDMRKRFRGNNPGMPAAAVEAQEVTPK